MSKLDELRRLAGGNAAESMGTAQVAPMHRPSPPPSATPPDRFQGITRSKAAAEIPVDRIGQDPDQPREEFDPEALQRLADSLKAKGQLQPIRVRWVEDRGQYVIICGERRWRAAGLAGIATMQCIISEAPADAGELLALQMIENCVREDLSPMEQARAYRQLIDRNGWSTRQVARELGVDQSNVVRALALLDLPARVQEHVEQGTLAPSVAYEVSKLDGAEAQADVAAQAVAGKMNRAEVTEAVRERSSRSARTSKGRGAKPKPRRTSATIRTAAGKLTLENRRGVDDETFRAALVEALDLIDARGEGRGEAA
jgi:ParB family chromosome partitioning protein